jgi:hypothetical protein
VKSDLAICRVMHWTYDELRALPASVYDVLIEQLNAEG